MFGRSRSVRIVAVGLFFFLAAPVLPYQQQSNPVMDEAARLFHAHEWAPAARAYEAIAIEQPNSAFVWFRLGIIYGHLQKLRDSAEAFERSGEIASYADPNVVRMLVFTYLKLGERDKAYEWLERWLEQGLRPDAMQSRPEFARLRNTPRFQALVRKAEKNDHKCDFAEARQFDFWVGEWDVQNHHEVGGATDRIEKILNGCAIQEDYSGYWGNHWRSISFYDKKLRKWRQTWMTDAGVLFEYVGEFRDGRMQMVGEIVRLDGVKVLLDRMTWRPLANGSVYQVFENSTDKGKTWYTVVELTYTPRKNQQAKSRSGGAIPSR